MSSILFVLDRGSCASSQFPLGCRALRWHLHRYSKEPLAGHNINQWYIPAHSVLPINSLTCGFAVCSDGALTSSRDGFVRAWLPK
jgi:hypothetical protein